MPEPLQNVDQQMLVACAGSDDSTNACVTAARQHLAAGGARVRARMCLEAGLRLGLAESDAVCLATTCELLHNASLVQDDLMDRTAMRRAQPSTWAAFGDTAAICTGDLMLAAAFGELARFSRPASLPSLLALVCRRTREVILGQTAEAVAGPAVQTPADTLAAYELLAKAKSASLLSLSLELPLRAAGHHASLEQACAAAAAFAVAYQIADDLEDVAQDALEGSLNIIPTLAAAYRAELVSLPLAHEPGAAYAMDRATDCARGRALELLELAAKDASELPNGCAAVLVDQAGELYRGLALSPVVASV